MLWSAEVAKERDPLTPISEQASHWWVVLHSEGASSADHREFGEWVARSPERVEAYLRTARLMRALKSRSVRWPGTPAEELIREAKTSPPNALRFSRVPVQDEGSRKYLPLRKHWAWAGVSTLAVAVVCAWLTLPHLQRYGTRLGEQRSILLDDGSRVTLNTASKIEVDLRRDRRVVRMIAGEALFEVAHDVTRPFDVEVRRTVVRAVGTQFDVDVRATRTTVTVLEGRVAVVERSDASGGSFDTRGVASAPDRHAPERRSIVTHGPNAGETGSALILTAAERLVITSSGPGTPEHVGNLEAATSWTQRQLIFQRTPVSEVAEEFNRYNHGRILIDSEPLQRQEVTGVFQSNDPGSFMEFLSGIPGVEIRITAQGDRIVTLRRAQR
jgi:transmembrane sensor